MKYPVFFDHVPGVRLRDPLAALLGSVEDGLLEYGYPDAVRLAGHSCPTVAAAYGLTRRALQRLYPEALPERGGIRVDFRGDIADGVIGVTANIVSLLTGAAGEGGFNGLGGRYRRRGLLAFGVDLPLDIRYTRCDGQGRVDGRVDLSRVPAAAELGSLMQRVQSGDADAGEAARFGHLWQDRVRRLLLEHGDDPEVFVLRSGD